MEILIRLSNNNRKRRIIYNDLWRRNVFRWCWLSSSCLVAPVSLTGLKKEVKLR